MNCSHEVTETVTSLEEWQRRLSLCWERWSLQPHGHTHLSHTHTHACMHVHTHIHTHTHTHRDLCVSASVLSLHESAERQFEEKDNASVCERTVNLHCRGYLFKTSCNIYHGLFISDYNLSLSVILDRWFQVSDCSDYHILLNSCSLSCSVCGMKSCVNFSEIWHFCSLLVVVVFFWPNRKLWCSGTFVLVQLYPVMPVQVQST